MADSKQMIELEVRQLQEQLLNLFEERKSLHREFEQLTNSSQQILLQIKEDTTSASERKLHNYEAEKRRIEEKLEVLEEEILEKDKKIAHLDSKAGEFLQQVSTKTTSNLSNIDSKTEIDGVANATTVGEGKEAGDVAGDGVCDVQVACSIDSDTEGGQSVKEINHSGQDEDVGKHECNYIMPEVKVAEELHSDSQEATPTDHMVTAASDLNGEELKCNGHEEEVVRSVVDHDSCSNDKVADEEKPSATSAHEPLVVLGVSEGNEQLKQDEGENIADIGNVSEGTHQLASSHQANNNGEVTGCEAMQDGPAATPVSTQDKGDSTGKQPSGSSSPVQDQVMSLSQLVAELRRVKDDMGKCMTVKEQSFLELEDQLQAANKEMLSLKVAMSKLERDLEDKKQGYHALEEENKTKKMDIELKIGEIQEVTNKCTMLSEEKADLLRKMEVLEIMMTEYRTEIEMLVGEKNQMEQQTKQLLAAKTATSTAAAEIDSRTSVEEKEKEIEELVEKIQSMEKEMKDLNDKLKVTNRHLKVMAREREYKQRECEVLKHKVETVEMKMCELQGTFDVLVKAVTVERDDLIKEMEGKNKQVDDLKETVVRLRETHEQELENVLYEKRLSEEELGKFRTGELDSPGAGKKFEEVTREKESLELKLKEKSEEAQALEQKVKTVHEDMTDFVNTLQVEMARLKDEDEKLKEEKTSLAETFASLQAEHNELQTQHLTLEKSLQELEKSSKEKSVLIESLKAQFSDVQQQLADANAKNVTLSTEMFKKEEESREELSAREATIQELTVTLTNNQKQSMENYNALQQDMNALQEKLKTSVDEHKKQQKVLEDKLKELQNEKANEVNSLQENIASLKSELIEKNEKLQAAEQCLKNASVEEKDKEIEKLNKKVEELTKAQQQVKEKKGGKSTPASEDHAGDLHQKLKELTAQLETMKQDASGNQVSESQEEFEASIDAKEQKIKQLESKVGDLEMCLDNKSGYITQLEGKLKESPALSNTAEAHLEQINKLSADISKLKDELSQTYEECKALKSTVTQLESDKKNIEDEKAKIVEEYKNKLHEANGTLEDTNAQLEEKKKTRLKD